MTDRSSDRLTSRLEVVWAIVLLQGAILLTVTLESLVANAAFGFLLIANLMLTAGAAVLSLASARGLRRRRRWARRTTILGESVLIVLGALELVATLLLAGTMPGLVPLIVTLVAPVTVLLLLRGSEPEFIRSREHVDEPASDILVDATEPADDPVLGTLLS